MEVFVENFKLWDFITLNPWSSFFTLCFWGALFRNVLDPKLVFGVRCFSFLVCILVLMLVAFVLEMAEFVDSYPFVYWIVLILVVDYMEGLPFRKRRRQKTVSKKREKK